MTSKKDPREYRTVLSHVCPVAFSRILPGTESPLEDLEYLLGMTTNT